MGNQALKTLGKVLIDSNILVYVSNSYIPEYKIARSFLEDLFKDSIYPVISTQNVKEAYRVLTHPVYLRGNKMADIKGIVSYWVNTMEVVYEDEKVWEEYIKLSEKYGVKGNEVFDLWLVATMKANGIKNIVTANEKHFIKYRGIKVLNPFK